MTVTRRFTLKVTETIVPRLTRILPLDGLERPAADYGAPGILSQVIRVEFDAPESPWPLCRRSHRLAKTGYPVYRTEAPNYTMALG